MNNFTIRQANINDVSTILSFIKALAEYEDMSDQVVATEELLKELFSKKHYDGIVNFLHYKSVEEYEPYFKFPSTTS